jgi:hypothetical protein
MAKIFKFPYSASRRVHSQKPRRSKNGTPEARAAKAAALFPTSADVVPMADAREQARSEVDGRKLRGSPLRDCVGTISFGATVVGKMHTAGLRGEPLAAIQSEIRKEWLETLDRAFEALATVSVGLTQAMNTLKALESETSDFPVNLPVHDLGQPVLNLATERAAERAKTGGNGPSFAEFLQGFKVYFIQEFERGRDVDQIFAGLEEKADKARGSHEAPGADGAVQS